MSASHQIVAGFMPLLDSAILVAAKEKGFAADGRHRPGTGARDLVGQHSRPHGGRPLPGGACARADADRLQPRPDAARGADHRADGARPRRQCGDRLECAVDADARSRRDARLRSRDDRRGPEAGHGRPRRRAQSPRCGLRSCIPTPAITTNCAIGSRPAASIPTSDVEIVIVPPPLMADALASGAIDGYCVGEPWSTAAALQGYGRIATVKAAIWRSSPEKVLSVGAKWAADNPDALAALLRALCRSAQWCGEPGNRTELAHDPLRQGVSRAARRMDAARLDRRPRRGRRRRSPGRRLLRAVRQGRDLPLEEPRAVVLFADGPLGTGAALGREREHRARDLSAGSLSLGA